MLSTQTNRGVSDVTKQRRAARSLCLCSSNRDAQRWPSPSHFSVPVNVRNLKSIALTQLAIAGVGPTVRLVQLHITNVERCTYALERAARALNWPPTVVQNVVGLADDGRTLTGMPADLTLVGSPVKLSDGLYSVVEVQPTGPDTVDAVLDRKVRRFGTPVRIAAPLQPLATVTSEDFEDVHQGDVIQVAGRSYAVVSKPDATTVRLDPTPAWDTPQPYDVVRGPVSNVQTPFAVLPVAADRTVALDRTAPEALFVSRQPATTRFSELEITVTDEYGRPLADLPHDALTLTCEIEEGDLS